MILIVYFTSSLMMLLSTILLITLNPLVAVKANPDLRPSIRNGSRVYASQRITITCTARATNLIGWSSVQYIGRGSQIVFHSSQEIGSSETRGDVVALLLSVTGDGASPVMETQLAITVNANYENFTVSCHNLDQGSADAVNFIARNDSAVTIKPDHETCIQHTSKAEIQCIARDTFFINFDWMIITGNSTYHTSFRCSPLDRTPSSFFNSTAFSSFSNSSMQDDRTLSLLCGIRIMPNVLLPNTTVLVTCSNVDVGISLRNALHIKESCQNQQTSTSTDNGRINFETSYSGSSLPLTSGTTLMLSVIHLLIL